MISQDERLMEKAIALSLKARIISPPNPWVGCLIVNHGVIVGEGYTQCAGSSHAEVIALQQAGKQASGSTVYVTLEPCSHYGRTPPCTRSLIEAKVSRVVIGLQDPDIHVCGNGILQLREAGIDVVVGVGEKAISENLAPYLYHRRTGHPYCIGKAAISIDGRIAAQDGSSQWISSPEARQETHRLRAESQAIIIGAGTACSDKPKLTVRNQEIMPTTPLLRVVLDSRGSVPPEGPLFDDKEAPTLIVTSESAPKAVVERWLAKGVEVAVIPANPNGAGVDLHSLLSLLGKREVLQVLVEGGGKLLGSFLENRLLQKFRAFIGPCFLGDKGIPVLQTNAIQTLNDAYKMQLLDVHIFGHTVNINYTLNA